MWGIRPRGCHVRRAPGRAGRAAARPARYSQRVKVVSIQPGSSPPSSAVPLAGGVLARDLQVDGERWSKGRRLSAADLAILAGAAVSGRGPWAERDAGAYPGLSRPVTILVAEPGDLHEDEAARRLAAAVGGPGLEARGPVDSRIDLVALARGAVRVRTAPLEAIDRIDGLAVFSVLDGQLVERGTIVASVKTGPLLVSEAVVLRAEEIATRVRLPIVDVRPYLARRVAIVASETLEPAARARFEVSLRDRVEGLGSTLLDVVFVARDAPAMERTFRELLRGRARPDVVLTAGAASTDPRDPMLTAFAAVGGRVLSHGVPAHPGSMLWLGRVRDVTFLGLPTCGSYSKATAVDLLLPWLLAGEPPTRATVARLGHGGLLGRTMRFRFPTYAQALHAGDG
jgi:hypothetical protein